MARPDDSAGAGQPEHPTKREPPSPTVMKRLQKCFEHASKQVAQENYDYATELFTQCVLGYPSHMVYVQNYIGNLQKKYNNNKKGSPLAHFKERGARSALKKAIAQSDWDEAIKNGITILKVNPWDVQTLTSLATVCERVADEGEGPVYTGFADCELFYLRCAVDTTPKDPEVCKQLGVALGKRKRFDEAIAFWHRVEQARPNDDEAQRAIASLAVEKTIVQGKYGEEGADSRGGKGQAGQEEELTHEERLKRRIARQPTDLSGYHELANWYLNADRFPEAEEVFNEALKVSGDDPDLREKIEDVQLRHLKFKMIAADKKAKQTGDEADKAEFDRIRTQVIERELVVYRSRCIRYPANLLHRYEVAVRLQMKGEYNEAIKEYQIAKNDPRRKGLSLLKLGECFRNIKQHRLAMQHFEAAIQEIPDRDADNKKLALYRAGKLAMGMKDWAVAEKQLSTLAALDFAYRDVSDLLKRIGAERGGAAAS
ncbi:MAG: tetratricopeptide repeat protein [Thermoguttaceae bacterium]